MMDSGSSTVRTGRLARGNCVTSPLGFSRVAASFISLCASCRLHARGGTGSDPDLPQPRAGAFAELDAEQRMLAADPFGPVDHIAIAQTEIAFHAARRLAARAHCFDDGRGTGDDVAARENAHDRGREIFVDLDIATLLELELRGLPENRIGIGPDGIHHGVAIEFELTALQRQRPAPS